MSLLQPPSTTSLNHRANINLPPLQNGQRYAHEIPNPTPIPRSKRADVLQLLHKYFHASRLNDRTMSESSRTSAPAYSVMSAETSISEMTFNFSIRNGITQREPANRRLDDVQRTRKALMRKLGACPEECRVRKVKCKLWHHALRELLENSRDAKDEEIVEWALRLDPGQENPRPETLLSTRVATLVIGEPLEPLDVVVNRVNDVLDMPPAVPTLYGSDILETDAALLGRYERNSPRPSALSFSVDHTPLPMYYSTSRQKKMFDFGVENDTSTTRLYKCQFLGCEEVRSALSLTRHYENEHHLFEHLQDPLRMYCRQCDNFQNRRTEQCLQCHSDRVVEALFGRFIDSLDDQDGMILGGISEYNPFSNQHQLFSGITDSFMNNGGGLSSYGNSWTDHSSTPGGSGRSYMNIIVNNFKQRLQLSLFRFKLPCRLLCQALYGHKYLLIRTCVAVLLLATANWKQDLLLSKTSMLMNIISSTSRNHIPRLGVILGFVAFTLHRVIVHAHHNSREQCGGWLSRCAINMFNKAYGRQPLAQTEYEIDRPTE